MGKQRRKLPLVQAETRDADAKTRAAEIEATLKRLTRLSERLLQLARAEGGRLRRDVAGDLRPVARLIVDDMARMVDPGRILLTLPDSAVMSDLDPDAFAILMRNLIENALRYGSEYSAVEVSLALDGTLIVANDGPVVPAEDLARLTQRFQRARSDTNGSGLGLAIVAAIAERTGCELEFSAPRKDRNSGFEARFAIASPGADR